LLLYRAAKPNEQDYYQLNAQNVEPEEVTATTLTELLAA
jgi:hypothetical protein